MFYKSSEEAFRDASTGNIIGFVEISSNCTETFPLFSEGFSDSGIVKVYLDQSDFQKTSFIKRKLYEALHNFTGSLLSDCGKLKRAGGLPIVIEVFFGELSFNLKKSIVPGFLPA